MGECFLTFLQPSHLVLYSSIFTYKALSFLKNSYGSITHAHFGKITLEIEILVDTTVVNKEVGIFKAKNLGVLVVSM